MSLVVVPAALVSWQQAIDHGRGLLSNAQIVRPRPDWRELLVVFAGYLFLCGPLLPLRLAPWSVAPPLGNMAAGVLLVALGLAIGGDLAADPV